MWTWRKTISACACIGMACSALFLYDSGVARFVSHWRKLASISAHLASSWYLELQKSLHDLTYAVVAGH
jgi:hypothetical protein